MEPTEVSVVCTRCLWKGDVATGDDKCPKCARRGTFVGGGKIEVIHVGG